MSDPFAFVEARYAEREESATASLLVGFEKQPGSGIWRVAAGGDVKDESFGDLVVYSMGLPTPAQVEHIAFNDPAYVIADITSKRAVLAAHRHYPNAYNASEIGCGICHMDRHMSDYGVGNWCETVRHLFAPFAGHPDFDRAWSVTP